MVWVLALALPWLRIAGLLTEPRLNDQQIHAIAGEPSRVIETQAGDRPLRILTWNIERGVRYDAIEAVLHQLDADIVLLQEVDRFCARSGYRDIAHDLAVDLRMNWISTGEFQEIGEGTRRRPCTSGQAILSRAPLESSFTVRFHDQASLKWTLNPAQPRRGGRVALAAATHGILCYSLHLESGADDNLRARQVNEIVGDSRSRSGPIIIAGDFNNAAGPDSPMFTALLTAVFVNTMSPDSPPARRPIDWIFARSLRGIASVELAREASDHDPVVLVAAPQP